MDSRYRCQCGSSCYTGGCTHCILSEVCPFINNISLSPIVYDSCIWLSLYCVSLVFVTFTNLSLSVTACHLVILLCRVKANNSNDKRGTSSGNEMELSSPPQRVSDVSPYVIPDTNGPYGSYTIIFIISYINTKWKFVRAAMVVASLHDFRLHVTQYQRRV